MQARLLKTFILNKQIMDDANDQGMSQDTLIPDCEMTTDQTSMQTAVIDANVQNSEKSSLQILDPEGDLIIHNGPLKILVSSSVLLLSTRYFKTMLKTGGFSEGSNQPRRHDPPVKVVADDDPDAFLFMCNILHYRETEKPKGVAHLAALADVCDYYGSERATAFHARAWIREWMPFQVTVPELKK